MGRVVLVVDDDLDTRDGVAEVLTGEGYVAAVASNGNEAMALLRKGLKPCVIALDLRMPELDGEAFLDLCGPHVAQPCSIIVMTALSGVDHVRLRADVKHFLPKPFEPTHLVELVKKVCP